MSFQRMPPTCTPFRAFRSMACIRAERYSARFSPACRFGYGIAAVSRTSSHEVLIRQDMSNQIVGRRDRAASPGRRMQATQTSIKGHERMDYWKLLRPRYCFDRAAAKLWYLASELPRPDREPALEDQSA